MKTRIITAALLAFGVSLFAQKKEIRSAEKANDKGNYAEAKAELQSVESVILNEDDKLQLKYYIAKSMAYAGPEQVSTADLEVALEANQKALEIEADSDEALEAKQMITNKIINSAFENSKSENFEDAMSNFEMVYTLNPQDTIYLFNAAVTATSAKKFDKALDFYSKLDEMGYTGIREEYYAVNKETGEEEQFGTKNERDLLVKSGDYIKAEDRMSKSQRADIVKRIALIYIEQDKTEEAITAIENAKKENPNDMDLMRSEAYIYNEMGDMEKYQSVMQEIVNAEPENATNYFNLGVSASQLGDPEGAIEYFKKAKEIDPNIANADYYIAITILEKEKPLIEEMNALGTSAADNKKYDELTEQRNDIYVSALPYLESSIESKPDNVNSMRTLVNIYYQLEMNDKAEAMNAKIKELEGN